MNYKHGRYRRKKPQSEPKEYFPNDNPVICKTFGCDRKLKPVEALYGEYCFNCAATRNQKERERMKLITSSSVFTVKKYKWDANLNIWDAIREIPITIEQFTMYIHNDTFNIDSTKVFYRYDICINGENVDTLYSYTPNLFDK